jgi:hypothetical protein
MGSRDPKRIDFELRRGQVVRAVRVLVQQEPDLNADRELDEPGTVGDDREESQFVRLAED